MKYALLLLLAVSVAAAQPGPFGGGRGFDGRGACMLEDKMDLTADQQKQVESYRTEMQKKQIDLTAKIKTIRLEIREMYQSENPDQKAIESKMTEIGRLQNEIRLDHTGFWFAVNKILNAEQKKIWKERGHMDGRGFREGVRGKSGQRGFRGEGYGRGGRYHRNCDGPCR